MSQRLPLAQQITPREPNRAFLQASVLVGLLVTIIGHLALNASGPAITFAVTVFALGVAIAVRGLVTGYPHAQIGWCNLVTLSRMGILAVFLMAVADARAPTGGLLAMAVVSLCLDGVDGWLARRQGLSSDFGARFDVEVDAVFALTLAVYGAVVGLAAPYVILLGLPYYIFGIARIVWPWLQASLPDSISRKTVCVAQIAVLIALLVPWIPGLILNLAVLAVIAGLAWSFGRDILWLYRART